MAEKREKKYVSDNAQLMAEWDWEKNNAIGLDPHKLVMGSHKYAFFRGNKRRRGEKGAAGACGGEKPSGEYC